ncbi:MAG: HAD family hydrolase [Verrucomicrobiales bacterium]|nr:HAD family hydrolase [Verrucomicrobiales bacterium]
MTDLIDILRQHASPLEPIPTGIEPRLEPLPGIRAVIFDIYGTLYLSGAGGIDSSVSDMECQALLKAGHLVGLRWETDGANDLRLFHDLIRSHQNRRRADGIEWPEVEIRDVWRDWLRVMRESLRLTSTCPDADLTEKLCLHFEGLAHPVWPAPGAAEAIASLKKRGMTLGLVSNAQFYTPLLFPALLGADSVSLGFREDLTIYSYRLREAKPSRRLYESAATSLRQLGILPKETLMIGNDLRNDIAPAAATGFRTALFAGDARSLRWHRYDPGTETILPDRILTDWSQLSFLLPTE